jgi:hypothetical protein
MGTRILYSQRNTGICSWPPSALCRRGQDSLATEDSPKSSLSFFRPEGGRKIKEESEAGLLVAASLASAGTSPTEGLINSPTRGGSLASGFVQEDRSCDGGV